MKVKVKITKCYLVQVLDEEDNELNSEYVFGDKTFAAQTGKRLKEEAIKAIQDNIEDDYADPDADKPWSFEQMERYR